MTSKIYGTANPGGAAKVASAAVDLAPTPHLRWYQAAPYATAVGTVKPKPVLQQWWAPNVPSYMITKGQGEWREVEVLSDE